MTRWATATHRRPQHQAPDHPNILLAAHSSMPASARFAATSAPTMTAGHLLFAVLLTGYIFIGVSLEERDLTQYLGAEYIAYRSETPIFIPRPRRKRRPAPS